jgi:MYXO-CTERM domain-containing protein
MCSPNAIAPAPAMSPIGRMVVLALLIAIGGFAVRRRSRSDG